MKVLLDCSHIATGGAIQNSLSILHHAQQCAQHEWQVIMTGILSRQFPRAEEAAFASVRRLDQWGARRTRYAVHLAMPSWERALKPDVCFTPGGPVYWRSRAPQVVSFAVPHLIYPEVDFYSGFSLLGRMKLRMVLRAARSSFMQADLLVVETATVGDRVARILGFPRDRIRVVGNTFSPVFQASVRNTSPRPKGDKFTIFVPSAYYRHKNLESIVPVARELQARGIRDVEFRLTLPPSSKSCSELLARAESAGVAAMVKAIGTVPHGKLAAHYRDADLIFLPTLLEASTAVYPEAFIAEVPLVTSDRDFARELCGDGARYVDPLSPPAMADALAELIGSATLRQKLVEAGRAALEARYITPEKKWADQLAAIESVA